MIFYVIVHKATGQLMPQLARDRGYSHWNPAFPDRKLRQSLGVPRLLKDEKQAKQVTKAWIKYQNYHTKEYQTYSGEWDEDYLSNQDGRTADDIEIVKVELNMWEKKE